MICPRCGDTFNALQDYSDHVFEMYRVMDDQAVTEWEAAEQKTEAAVKVKAVSVATTIRGRVTATSLPAVPATRKETPIMEKTSNGGSPATAPAATKTEKKSAAARKAAKAPRACGNCRKPGHRVERCPEPKTGRPAVCGYCKRSGGEHSKGCRRKASGGGKPRATSAPARAAATPNGAYAAAIAALRTERGQLHDRIEVIDDVIERLETIEAR